MPCATCLRTWSSACPLGRPSRASSTPPSWKPGRGGLVFDLAPDLPAPSHAFPSTIRPAATYGCLSRPSAPTSTSWPATPARCSSASGTAAGGTITRRPPPTTIHPPAAGLPEDRPGTVRVRTALDPPRILAAVEGPHHTRLPLAAFPPSAPVSPRRRRIACLWGHTGMSTSVATSPRRPPHLQRVGRQDGSCLGRRTGAELACLRGHEMGSRAWLSHPTAHGSQARPRQTVRLWDTRTGAEAACLRGHQDWVTSVAFTRRQPNRNRDGERHDSALGRSNQRRDRAPEWT